MVKKHSPSIFMAGAGKKEYITINLYPIK